jgi:hypothetical protein
MKDNFIYRIENTFQGKVFTDDDLKILFPEKELAKIHNSLSYHLKIKHIKKYRRGLYSLAQNNSQSTLSKFIISNFLYGPSYISFESALSYYNLIPEAVYETTAACFQEKKKVFKTAEGIFSFSQIPLRPFFLEVIKDEKEKYLIAKPIRALFDLIYLQRKQYASLENLEDDLRIDLDELKEYIKDYDASSILKLGEMYKKKSTTKLSEILIKGYK